MKDKGISTFFRNVIFKLFWGSIVFFFVLFPRFYLFRDTKIKNEKLHQWKVYTTLTMHLTSTERFCNPRLLA